MRNQLFIICILSLISCATPAKDQLINSSSSDQSLLNHSLDVYDLNSLKIDPNKFTFNGLEPGIITSTGLKIGETTYSMLIDTLDPKTLLSMPQMKIEDEHLYIPKKTITIKAKDNHVGN